jgi:hypothetical protein
LVLQRLAKLPLELLEALLELPDAFGELRQLFEYAPRELLKQRDAYEQVGRFA